jgi:hypothetical protein
MLSGEFQSHTRQGSGRFIASLSDQSEMSGEILQGGGDFVYSMQALQMRRDQGSL